MIERYHTGNRAVKRSLPDWLTPLTSAATTIAGMAKVTKIGGRQPPQIYIAEWLTKRGINQAQLAARMDTTAATVSRKMAAKRSMKIEDLAWFAHALDLQPEDLLRHPDRPSADELLRGASPEIKRQAFNVIQALRTGTDN